ncbi:unnamed protein product [Didymodactylos carnosus]|uniref:Adenosine deaminase n=2 Tax=Didymodactylos carnosus TaxID=1234261 RepID=A0A814E692_9BILA|nr:unnamed protein product [Didymodactylos carnosus]CAF3740116.1 unnamed protein product [Didymodactylos carnosus]
MLARDNIRQHDLAFQSKNNLNVKENVVNLYFELLKSHEFNDTTEYFYPSQPIETEVINITNRPLYRFLKLLPKGGNLHIHENQILDRKRLLEVIQNSSEYELLHICDQSSCETEKYYLKYFKSNIPQGWTKVKGSNWTISDIVRKTTLTGILNDLNTPIYATDTAGRWSTANKYGVFNFYSDLVKHNATRFHYMKAVLDSSLEENVQLLELRRGSFGSLFYFNSSGSRISISATDELDLLTDFKKDYMEKNPKLIDFVFLLYNSRSAPKENIKNEVDKVIDIQRLYPDFIRGYDLVGEEDHGHTLLFHSDSLIHAFNHSQNSGGSFNLLFHAGETNWPEDHLSSNDDVSTFENIYDALVLRTHRIGHGLSLAKRPDMYQYIRDRQIAIEICPASNQLLDWASIMGWDSNVRGGLIDFCCLLIGYVADLRNHPGIVYHRSGIPIVLSGDDPGSFGYNQLTVDFYLASMAWGLNLADLKQFAWNSIEYSTLPESRKKEGFTKWTNEWNLFIDSVHESACNHEFTNVVHVSTIFPQYGPNNLSINVTLYGSGYESSLCKKIICKFGDTETEGIFFDINEILCPTPIKNGDLSNVPVSITIDGTPIATNLSYSFVSSLIVTDDNSIISSELAAVGNVNKNLIVGILMLVFSLTIV